MTTFFDWVGKLVLVKRRGRWVNGTVRGVSLDGTNVVVQFVDDQETDNYPVYATYLQTQEVPSEQPR